MLDDPVVGARLRGCSDSEAGRGAEPQTLARATSMPKFVTRGQLPLKPSTFLVQRCSPLYTISNISPGCSRMAEGRQEVVRLRA